jgi:hypothetical protein
MYERLKPPKAVHLDVSVKTTTYPTLTIFFNRTIIINGQMFSQFRKGSFNIEAKCL